MLGPETWWVICTKCGAETNATDLGIVRVGARSKGKRLLVRCPACGRHTFARVVQRPRTGGDG